MAIVAGICYLAWGFSYSNVPVGAILACIYVAMIGLCICFWRADHCKKRDTQAPAERQGKDEPVQLSRPGSHERYKLPPSS